MLDERAMREAFYARDARCDGRFVTGVTTTGIYCLPSCPARKPKPENVRFFPTPEAARAAGFRACLRCEPDRAASREAALAARAAELARSDARLGRPGALARHLGVPRSRLSRAFRRARGEPLSAFLRRQRVLAAADRLREGATVRAAAREAGYRSLGAFYAAFRRLKGAPPAAWRASQEARA